MKFVLCSVLAASALVGCGPSGRSDQGLDDATLGDDAQPAGPGSGSGTPRECNKMDIVFVVDDSGSMSEEQNNLASNFPMFANVLANYTTSTGEHIDFRVALTTTGKNVTYTIDLLGTPLTMTEHGPDGAFQNNCGVATRWLDTASPNLGQTLGCRANVGTGGASLEMPLLMTKHALAERIADGTNAGFLRDDAMLAVVMLTDEDDGSSTHGASTADPIMMSATSGNYPTDFNPADAVQFLDTLKGHRSRWAAGVIAGDGDCTSSFGSAANAARLKQFVTLANGNGTTQAVFSSICEGDLTNGLTKALDLFQAACTDVIF